MRTWTDAAIVQAGGRGRGVNRTADTPLEVWVMGNVITPWPVVDIARWQEVALDPVMRMAARGAVLASPTDAWRLYPDLFVSAEAAKKAMQRRRSGGDFGDIPLLKAIYKEMSPKSAGWVSYRPTGRGQQTRHALVTAAALPAFRARLEALLGPLAVYEVAEPAAEKPAAAADAATDEPVAPEPACEENEAAYTSADALPRSETPSTEETHDMPDAAVVEAEPAGLDPAVIYRGPVAWQPPVGLYRTTTDRLVEETEPKPQLAPWLLRPIGPVPAWYDDLEPGDLEGGLIWWGPMYPALPAPLDGLAFRGGPDPGAAAPHSSS